MGKGLTFLVGGVIGAAAALMLSPNTGERNREIAAEKIGYYTEHSGELVQRASDQLRDKISQVSEPASPSTDDIRAKINEARDRIAEQITRNQVVADVEADVEDVAEAAAEVAEEVAE